MGRFLQPDPLVPEPGNPQAFNRYAYVYSNPLRYVDDGGHLPILPLLVAGAVIALKVIDYGWTAYDLYQSGQVLSNPNANQEEKWLAGLNIALAAALEAGEPDDEILLALPLDDVGRRALIAEARRAMAEGGEGALERYLRERLGSRADSVLRWIRQQATKTEAQVIERHHLLPREFRPYFERVGLNIDSPEFIVELPRDLHRLKPYGLHTGLENWNKMWLEFFIKNPNATKEKILQHLDWMMRRYGL